MGCDCWCHGHAMSCAACEDGHEAAAALVDELELFLAGVVLD